MWDIVTPITLDDQYVGYVFSGQFFFDDEPLDDEFLDPKLENTTSMRKNT